jgi:hypothetical protein
MRRWAQKAAFVGRAVLIEQALYFAIGFLVAALAAVVGLPFVSRRATRLANVRARLQAPATEKEAIAERDALRAQHAVDSMRLERRAMRAEETATQMRATLGEKSVRVLTLEGELSEGLRVSAEQREEIERLSAEGRHLGAELGAARIALNDAFAQRDKASDAEAAALARQNELEAEASRDRARIAILIARAESMETIREDVAPAAKAGGDAESELAQALAAENARTRFLEERPPETANRSEDLLQMQARAEAAEEKSRKNIVDLEARLAASEQAREETLLENGRQLAAIADRETQLEAARAETAALHARLAALPADPVAGEPRADDDALREAIKRLGREVGRLFAAQKAAHGADSDAPTGPFVEDADRDAPMSDEGPGLTRSAEPRLARPRAPRR